MVDPEEMQDRHTAQLAELAEIGMGLARVLAGRAQAAETPEAAEGLALAFHRISRSVRLTLALESRLAREQAVVRRVQGHRRRELDEIRLPQVRHALACEIWNEADGAEAEALLEDLETLLSEEVLFERLSSGPLDAVIGRLRGELNLSAEALGGAPANDSHDMGDGTDDGRRGAGDHDLDGPGDGLGGLASSGAPPPQPSG